jgi:hypothetical protein
LTYKLHPRIWMYQIFHTFIAKLVLINFFHFLEFMVSCMIMPYELRVTLMNEKIPQELSLDLTLT